MISPYETEELLWQRTVDEDMRQLDNEARFWMAELQEREQDAKKTIGILLSMLENHETAERIENLFLCKWGNSTWNYEGRIASDDSPRPYHHLVVQFPDGLKDTRLEVRRAK
jgi:hypothetical protein